MGEGEKTIPDHARQGIETVAAIHARTQQAASRHHVAIERATAEIGRPRTLYLILGATTAWATWNSLARAFGWPCPDPPPFTGLQGFVSFSALLLTTMVLTTQNRHAHVSEARSQLDLQVSLLAEQKVAKLIQLVEELRVDLPNVRNREDPLAKEMQQSVNAAAVQEAIEQSMTDDATGRP